MVRKVEESFPKIIDNPRLDDTSYEHLFRISTSLVNCGYYDSLCLPKAEKLNYIENNIEKGSIGNLLASSIKSKSLREIILLLISIALVSVSLFYDYATPPAIDAWIIEVPLPFSIPIIKSFGVLFLAIFAFRYIRFNQYKFKEWVVTLLNKGDKN